MSASQVPHINTAKKSCKLSPAWQPHAVRDFPLVICSFLAILLTGNNALAAEWMVSPEEDFCKVFNEDAGPGDVVLLLPGMHNGPCVLSTGGLPGEPKVLRAQNPDQLTAFVYNGNSSNIIDVKASDIVIDGFFFGPSNDAITAIKIKSGDRTSVLHNHFFQIGGISVAANSSDSEGIEIRENLFEDLMGTGIYLGCHPGMSSCTAADFLIADNLFTGVDSEEIGYGLEIKRDSYGIVRDNVIDDTKGPGIEIYGSSDLSRINLVEGNIVGGSRTSASLEIAGGPTIVRNNIVLGGNDGGLLVYNYGGNGFVHEIQILGNTIIGDEGPAVDLLSWVPGKSLEMTGNVVWQESGAGPAMPAPIPDTIMNGNVDCTSPGECWVDAMNRDLWPLADGPLLTMGAVPMLAELEVDFCGNERGEVPHVGALEWIRGGGPGPLPHDYKSAIPCPMAGGGTTGGSTTGGDTTGGDTTGGDTTGGDTTGTGTSSGDTSGTPTSSSASETGNTSSNSGPTGSSGTNSTATAGDDEDSDDEGCACRTNPESEGSGLVFALWGLFGLGLLRRHRSN